ncbi:hypothetical protein [Streptoalloteichus hindustanus]|uniref:Uncharacterized protein n=1 Tax=Streptoalloteichus hindustanus TaxID=2017 RepID=A0A1M5M9L9_STRHI|nr:hypothetical protein [Streptoalloteichus hindustanus]SHG73931.1 hypothetical protein SAMN05444320_11341 [Streptoalloteichus hindustanus]
MNTIRRIRSFLTGWLAPTPTTAECVCCRMAMDETLMPEIPRVCFSCWVCCGLDEHVD